MQHRLPWEVLLITATVISCGSSNGGGSGGQGGSAKLCVPGQSIACVGVAACQGGQVCNADGSEYGPCQCGSGGNSSGGSSTGGGGTAGSDGSSGGAGGSVAGTGGSAGGTGASGLAGSSGLAGMAGGPGGGAGGGGGAGIAGGTGAGGSCGAGTGGAGGAGGIGTASCWVGDFDGDGIPDCAKAAPTAYDLSFFKGLGAGNYSITAVVTQNVVPGPAAQLLSAPLDMTADGRADLVFSVQEQNGPSLFGFYGNSDGTFSTSPASLGGTSIGPSYALKENGIPGVFDPASGRTDLFVVTAAPASIGSGELYWHVVYEPAATSSGAGYPRLAIRTTDAGFILGSEGGLGGPVAVGDVDGDHNLDGIVILTRGIPLYLPQTTQVYIAYGNGDRSFKAGINAVAGTERAKSVQTQDVNNDGKLDLVVGFPNIGCLHFTTFYGDGAGNFSTTPP